MMLYTFIWKCSRSVWSYSSFSQKVALTGDEITTRRVQLACPIELCPGESDLAPDVSGDFLDWDTTAFVQSMNAAVTRPLGADSNSEHLLYLISPRVTDRGIELTGNATVEEMTSALRQVRWFRLQAFEDTSASGAAEQSGRVESGPSQPKSHLAAPVERCFTLVCRLEGYRSPLKSAEHPNAHWLTDGITNSLIVKVCRERMLFSMP
ncbi:unnamed protein product [Protopolystoma xenopodis]|uniref:Uncharacterized protein n=1 Tax=Protopolystoma xenopodis TaxID=117903 RepID=A0A3S5AEL0_9PLAT|nr:unnamed protein product [Protopolystoma xenopodis]